MSAGSKLGAPEPIMSRRETWLAFCTGWRLVAPHERVRMLWLALLIIAVSAIDMIAISSVMPLVMLVMGSEALTSSAKFQMVIEWLGNPSRETLILWSGLGTVTFITLATVANIGTQAVVIRFGARCSARLARELMLELIRAPYAWFLGRNSTLLTRLVYSDVAHWGSNFVQRTLYIGHNMSTMLFAIGLVVFTAPLTGILALVIVGGIGWAILSFIRPYIQRMATRNRKAVDDVVMAADQGFSGIKDIKLSSREKFFTNLYHRAFQVAIMSRARIIFVKGLPSALMLFFGQFTMIALAVSFWQAGLSIGEIAAQMALLLLISSRFIPALNRLSGDITTFWDAFPYIKGISDMFDSIAAFRREADEPCAPDVPALQIDWNTLQFRNVAYRYPSGSEAAVYGLDLTLERGKAFGIAGPSGAGKSTLIDLIVGLLSPTDGQILLDDRPLQEAGVRNWQYGISYVPQAPFMADATLRENVAFGIAPKKIDDDRVRQSLRLANLEELVESLSDGIETSLGDRGLRFSGGQKQRVAIARALYDRPSILVLDEATSALDAENERIVQKAIDGLHGDITTVTITHRMQSLRYCDWIFVMDAGQIVDQGTFEQLSHRNQMFLGTTEPVNKTEAGPQEQPAAKGGSAVG
jgi:ABC-type multidrug transport system fused ATPase/permease subunit